MHFGGHIIFLTAILDLRQTFTGGFNPPPPSTGTLVLCDGDLHPLMLLSCPQSTFHERVTWILFDILNFIRSLFNNNNYLRLVGSRVHL